MKTKRYEAEQEGKIVPVRINHRTISKITCGSGGIAPRILIFDCI
jgi:hypothetical protein